MANIINRWTDYNNNLLTPPCVVQCDHNADEYLIWVWTGDKILGPISRSEYNEARIVDEVMESYQAEQSREDDEWQQ